MARQGGPQSSLSAQASASEEEGVLAARLAKIRALPEGRRPADAASWLRSEELLVRYVGLGGVPLACLPICLGLGFNLGASVC